MSKVVAAAIAKDPLIQEMATVIKGLKVLAAEQQAIINDLSVQVLALNKIEACRQDGFTLPTLAQAQRSAREDLRDAES